ncbi:MAG: hypothetical protein MJ002_05145 [Paludibacteraceae bacterium]|nr:hypothetical protein [Paludibacteraceae bacterium]
MKKIFFFAVLAAAFTFAACGNEEATEEQPMEDTVVVAEEPVVEVDTMVVDTPVVEEPQVAPVKKSTKKAEPAKEPEKIDPTQLKKPGDAAIAKKLTPGEAKQGIRISKEKPVVDNGNTVKSGEGVKTEAGQNEIGPKKKGLNVK